MEHEKTLGLACAAALALFMAGTSMAANAAATYYVSQSSGNDANDGKSLATAWKTFGKLNAFKLAPGDKVVVAPGLQEESLKPAGGGTADNPVVIQFLPGIHTINIRNVTRVPLFVSNTMDSDDPKPVGILLEGCKHLRLQAAVWRRGEMILCLLSAISLSFVDAAPSHRRGCSKLKGN